MFTYFWNDPNTFTTDFTPSFFSNWTDSQTDFLYFFTGPNVRALPSVSIFDTEGSALTLGPVILHTPCAMLTYVTAEDLNTVGINSVQVLGRI